MCLSGLHKSLLDLELFLRRSSYNQRENLAADPFEPFLCSCELNTLADLVAGKMEKIS
jgi:hypothetical protein